MRGRLVCKPRINRTKGGLHYPGQHRAELVLNGAAQEIGSFELRPAPA